MKDKDNFMPRHEPGNGRLRDLLHRLDEDQEKLFKNPIYVEGYDDGFVIGKKQAEEEAKSLVRALTKLFNEEKQ
jgi:hypothetical protein